MSGFEIAGVVLGAFPLAIEGFKAYESLARLWEIWDNIEREHKKCLNDLNYHHIIFEDNLRRLLLPLVVQAHQIDSLISQPQGQEWKDAGLDQALRCRLHRSYDIYLETICSLQSLIINAKEHLGIDSPGVQARLIPANPSSNDRSFSMKENMRYQRYRFKFSMRESDRNEFFGNLQKYNDRLERLLTSSDQVRNLERNLPWSLAQYAGSTSDLEICKFWQHAEAVYITFSKAWTCNCVSQHRTQLMLQHRTKDDKEMRLILRASVPDPTGLPVGHGVTIRQSTDPTHTQEDPTPAPLPPSKVPGHRMNLSVRSALKTDKDSRRGGRKLNPSVVKLHELPKTDPKGTTTDNQLITNLCYKLQEGFNSGTRPEYLQGEKSKYYICARPQSMNELQTTQPSLEDVLRGAGYKFDRRQRYTTSHILASSFVQLQNTSWIVSSWGKSSVVFPEPAGNTSIPDRREPFVTHRFCERTTKHETDLPAQNLGSLAVTLLELCFGNVIEDHPKRAKLPVGVETPEIKAAFDFAAASEWLRDVEGEAGPDFANAIEWCLFKHKTSHDKAN